MHSQLDKLRTALSTEQGKGATKNSLNDTPELDNVLWSLSYHTVLAQAKIEVMQSVIARYPKVCISCKGSKYHLYLIWVVRSLNNPSNLFKWALAAQSQDPYRWKGRCQFFVLSYCGEWWTIICENCIKVDVNILGKTWDRSLSGRGLPTPILSAVSISLQ